MDEQPDYLKRALESAKDPSPVALQQAIRDIVTYLDLQAIDQDPTPVAPDILIRLSMLETRLNEIAPQTAPTPPATQPEPCSHPVEKLVLSAVGKAGASTLCLSCGHLGPNLRWLT